MEASPKDEVADGHAHDWCDKDDLPGQLRNHHDGQEGGDEEEDGNDDARHVVIQAGAGVLEDGVAVEDHDVEAGEVHDEVHGDGDEERLEDGGLQEVVDGDLVLQRLLYFSLDLGNLPGDESTCYHHHVNYPRITFSDTLIIFSFDNDIHTDRFQNPC